MENFYINADSLEQEEILYELNLRDLPVNTNADNCRILRYWFRTERSNECETLRTIDDEYPVALAALKQIEELLKAGRKTGCRSRLVHYYRRLRRCQAFCAQDLSFRQTLIDCICRLATSYLQLDMTKIEFVIPFGNPSQRNPFRRTLDPNQTSASQRTLVTPPGSNPRSEQGQEPNGEGAVGGNTGTDPIHEQRVQWAKQVLQEVFSDAPTARTRQSMDSRIPAPNNLRQELEQAAHGMLSADGTRLPFRGGPNATPAAGPSVNNSLNPFWESMLDSSDSTNDPRSNQPDHRSVREPGVPLQSTNLLRTDLGPSSNEGGRTIPPRGEEQPPRFTMYGLDSMPSPEPRNPPVNQAQDQEPNSMEYVHVSEIENYVQTYVRQLLSSQPSRPIVRDTMVNNLARQITDFGLHDPEVSRLSRPDRAGAYASQGASRLSPPLQLQRDYGNPFEHRAERNNVETPRIFRDSHRNSWPNYPIQADSTHYGDPPSGNLRNEPTDRLNFPPGPSGNLPRAQPGTFNQPPRGRLPHQTCNILEKWPKFAGDTNPVPVVDFLRQINLLCRSYQISKEELKTHAHLLFKEDAYAWYTAYEPKFDSWDTLLNYLRMRYDNPNRDRFIKEELRNRKQRPNELFSAFLTDIETLSQRMIKRISEEEKFEIVLENMKMSYKRRLALENIGSLEHLAQLCYRFDALESNLYHPRGTMKTPAVNEVLLEEADGIYAEEAIDELEIAAIQARRTVINNSKESSTRKMEGTDRPKPVCWNCQKAGHLWKDCDQKKAIFCHICGHPDTTAFKCPQQHDIRPASESKTKND